MSTAADSFERKPRHASDIKAFVDYRMYQWAKYARDRFSDLGYPKESISTKLLREITLGINSPSGFVPDTQWPKDVTAVEQCVVRLCRSRSTWGEVIHATYLVPRDEPNEARARRMRVSVRRYNDLLSRFRVAMFGALMVEDDYLKNKC